MIMITLDLQNLSAIKYKMSIVLLSMIMKTNSLWKQTVVLILEQVFILTCQYAKFQV